VKDLASRFSEVELRVRALVAENRALRAKVRELERERDTIGAEARDAGALREKTTLVRERLQRLLAALEALGQATQGEGADLAGGETAAEGNRK
jgi:hypothetical protein